MVIVGKNKTFEINHNLRALLIACCFNKAFPCWWALTNLFIRTKKYLHGYSWFSGVWFFTLSLGACLVATLSKYAWPESKPVTCLSCVWLVPWRYWPDKTCLSAHAWVRPRKLVAWANLSSCLSINHPMYWPSIISGTNWTKQHLTIVSPQACFQGINQTHYSQGDMPDQVTLLSKLRLLSGM